MKNIEVKFKMSDITTAKYPSSFFAEEAKAAHELSSRIVVPKRFAVNEKCICGSGKKYKKCCKTKVDDVKKIAKQNATLPTKSDMYAKYGPI